MELRDDLRNKKENKKEDKQVSKENPQRDLKIYYNHKIIMNIVNKLQSEDKTSGKFKT